MSVSNCPKKELRSYLKALILQEMSVENKTRQLQLDTVLNQFLSDQNGIWGAYRSLKTEASVDTVLKDTQKVWVFPKMNREQLDFFQPHGFTEGPYGILEPSSESSRVELSKVSGLLIPGLGFNKNGNRLGKGKGFYDRALLNYQGVKVGICFNFQLLDRSLPTDRHDVRVDFVICENGVVDCRKYRE